MATEVDVRTQSFEAGADLSAAQYRCVEMGATYNQVTLCNGATDSVVGILQNKPAASGRAAEVAVGGICKAKAGGVVTRGDYVGTNATGYLVTKSTDNDKYIGQALQTAAAEGDIIEVDLDKNGYIGA